MAGPAWEPQTGARPGRAFHFEWHLRSDRFTASREYDTLLAPAKAGAGHTGSARLALMHPDDRDAYQQLLARLSPASPGYRTSYRLRSGDARDLLLQEQGFAHFDAQGHVNRLSAIAVEISGVQEPQAAPGLSAAFTRKLLDASLNGLYVHDLKHNTNTFINAQYTRLTGYTPEQLNAMNKEAFLALFHPEDARRVATHMAALNQARDGDMREIEYRFRHRDGRWIWCLSRDAVFERNSDGSVRSIIGTFLDIGARKHAELGLRRSEARARRHLEEIELIYDSVPIGLCVLDRDLRFVRINERLAEINGIPAADHIGRTVRDIVPQLADQVEPQMRRVLETGEPVLDIEINGETRSQPGVQRTWIESWLPLRDQHEQISGISIVAREVSEERKALSALAESRERYRLVADYTYDWEYWMGAAGELQWMSPSCERITGYPPAAFLADPGLLVAICHPDDAAALREHLQASLRDQQQPLQFQFRIRHADGDTRWMENISQPVFAADGGFAGRRASARDITQAKRAEQALSESETRFRSTFDNAAVGIAHVNPEGRFLRINRRLCEITGYDPDELTRMCFQDITHPDDLEADLAHASRLHAGEISDYSMEKRYIRKDGSPVWIKLTGSVVRKADGSPDYFIAVVDDISERRDAEARARTLAKVVETSGDFIGVAGLDGRAIYLNRAGQALVGLDGDAAVAATVIEDYLFPEDLPYVRETVLPTVLREGRWAGEFRFRHFASGEPVEVHWDVVRIDDPHSGEPLRLATVTRDIRRQKASEAALREADRRKDEFLACLGHELRNPMAPIRNAVEILQLHDSGQDPSITQTLQILERQTAHLSHLLDDLLDVSRIVLGEFSLTRSAVDVGDVIREAADGARPLMQARRHRFEVKLPGEAILVDGDRVRLSQIILNLLLNAARYTQEGGEIQVATQADDAQVAVLVRDNGPGIPPEQLDGLYAPFARGQRPDRTASGGLGLGLTISRQLAELQGGRLHATSNWPQPGSEFRLELPRLPNSPQPAASEPAALRPGRQHLRLLVVDDNTDVAFAFSTLLRVLGYAVDTASSAAEALTLVRRHCPRVAFLDIGLPDMDGLELARRLRTQYPDKDTLLLVAVTGYGHDEARERSLAAGFDMHLAKPVDRNTLQSLLERIS